MDLTNIENFDSNVLDEINDILNEKSTDNQEIINMGYYTIVSEMTYMERRFLNGIIRKVKPKKILELGVCAGGSSAIILNAIKDIENSRLYSVDYNPYYWKDISKKCGFIIDEKFQHLKNKWKLYTGGVAAKFMDNIGGDIDLCLLDTAHINPGEFLDFLMVLPYLKKNAIVILHDTLFQLYRDGYTNAALFSSLKGKKITISEGKLSNIGNIGAVILDENIMDNVFDYFYLLTLKWQYLPSDEDFLLIEKLFSKFYNKDLINMYWSIVLMNKDLFKNNILKEKEIDLNNKIEYLLNQNKSNSYNINKIINTLAWWIPIRKWRDTFRSKFAIKDQTRPDQTRPDQTRPDLIKAYNDYICFYDNLKYKKIQYKIAA